ncbi:MAG: P-loop NTPase [Thermoleophilia bacterium]
MQVAIASGKGGTGKTTVATNLATVLTRDAMTVQLLDADVEEPNSHLFVAPDFTGQRDVTVTIPSVDATRCTLCGRCGSACVYKAILVLPTTVLVYPELCHSCGACSLVCPEEAIHDENRITGTLEWGTADALSFARGTLSIGEAKAVPAVKAVVGLADHDAEAVAVIIDAPPGTSCPVIEAVRNSDIVLLVTEPTPFGLNDLRLAVDMVRALDLPAAVAINRAGTGDGEVARYCREQSLPVVLELPDERAIAEASTRGVLAVDALPELAVAFRETWRQLTLLSLPQYQEESAR